MTPGRGASVVEFRAATPDDAAEVRALLVACALPLNGIPMTLDGFTLALAGGHVVATAAVERYGPDGLLRSVAVDAGHRGSGLGHALMEHVLLQARLQGVESLYLLTTTADAWFPRFGFRRVAREAVPSAVRASVEFAEACPASAVVMALPLTP